MKKSHVSFLTVSPSHEELQPKFDEFYYLFNIKDALNVFQIWF
jgi:hypothetical protein